MNGDSKLGTAGRGRRVKKISCISPRKRRQGDAGVDDQDDAAVVRHVLAASHAELEELSRTIDQLERGLAIQRRRFDVLSGEIGAASWKRDAAVELDANQLRRRVSGLQHAYALVSDERNALEERLRQLQDKLAATRGARCA